jgi:hypothetical protein
LAALQIVEEVRCGRDDEGRWWVEFAGDVEATRHLAESCRGVAYRQVSSAWRRDRSSRRASAPLVIQPDHWTWVDAAALAAAAAFPSARLQPAPALSILAPAPLAAAIARRAYRVGAGVTLTRVVGRPLGETDATEAMKMAGYCLLRLRRQTGMFSVSFMQALCDLPNTLLGTERGNVLMDARLAGGSGVLAEIVPEGEMWAIGPPEAGRWRLSAVGSAEEASVLFSVRDAPRPVLPPSLPPTRAPHRSPLVVRRRPGAATRIDALLLDELELSRFARIMRGRQEAETIVVAPGNDFVLAHAPGGMNTSAPFGLPLTRIGPGALFIEADCVLDPPLPPSARATLFPPTAQIAHVLTRDGPSCYALDAAEALWGRWLGEVPKVDEVRPEALVRFVRGLAGSMGGRLRLEASDLRAGQQRPFAKEDRRSLIRDAQRLEWSGNLIGAAEAMERLGDYLAAARLFERAAEEAME